ncbi:hypothetical protein [Okeania sp. KiyG1]|uniref:hypothetical protein n=1 Tax=Okeania sp. KiyG1 TaxID=2720165 RepID=UPI001920D6F0|nr:hypothetical protein [Okeania sp. KiyG1]GGA28318.1 hypothetical protein CYANOKiyG1_44570 [Okeania sp. KiyG1]
MTDKEKIYAEIESISEEYFEELYWLIKKFADAKPIKKESTFMSKLKSIQIDGPEDFAANLDLYLSGEKSVE